MRNPLSNGCHRVTPSWRGFRKSHSERSHESACAVTLLEEPLSPQWLTRDPVKKIGIDRWPNRFHQIASQTVTRGGIDVQYTDTRIKAERSQS